DTDGNRLDDVFDAAQASIDGELSQATDASRRAILLARLDERVSVEAVFSGPVTSAARDAFVRAGGTVRHVFRAVSYGFTATLRPGDLAKVAALLGKELILLKADRLAEHHLDEATRNGRVRPVWAASFGGGYNGAADINIAIMDTGVDGTHTDLAGRSVGW